MQWVHSRFEAHTYNDKRKSSLDSAIVALPSQAIRHVRHVKRTCRHVQKADTNYKECCADSAHDEVVICGGQCTFVTVRSLRYQDVCGKRRDFEKHKNIERVTRNHNTHEASDTKHEAGVEKCMITFWNLVVYGFQRERQYNSSCCGDQK